MGREQLSAVQTPLVSELARLQIITDSLGADVVARGVLTGKGRTRAAVTAYLAVLDRQQRLAQLPWPVSAPARGAQLGRLLSVRGR